MKWKSEYNWGRTSWKGRKNSIKFNINECYNGFDRKEIIGYYASCTLAKDEEIVLNTLWIRDEFKTLEETQEWCEELKPDKLIELREIGLNKK